MHRTVSVRSIFFHFPGCLLKQIKLILHGFLRKIWLFEPHGIWDRAHTPHARARTESLLTWSSFRSLFKFQWMNIDLCSFFLRSGPDCVSICFLEKFNFEKNAKTQQKIEIRAAHKIQNSLILAHPNGASHKYSASLILAHVLGLLRLSSQINFRFAAQVTCGWVHYAYCFNSLG